MSDTEMSVKESQAYDLLVLVRGPGDVDKKIAEFVTVKALVKHNTVHTVCIEPLFEACRVGVSSPNSTLSAQALSCLGHLTKRVSIQDPSRLRTQTSTTLPLLVDKLGDAKERNKTVALAAIIDMHRHHSQDVEKAMKELGFGSKNARVRLESIRWLAQTHALNPSFSFKSYTPLLIGMLEDSNEPVREAAKNIVVELFSTAPEHAKSDLKRELQKRGVRKGIANYIVSQLGIPGGVAEILVQDGQEEESAPSSAGGPRTTASISGSMASSTYMMSLPGVELENLPPVYVNTNRELEDIFDGMVAAFEGKESEHNWVAREGNVLQMRKMLRGNAYRDFQITFLTRVKSLLDGILKTFNSLRTTTSTMGGQFIKDLAIIAGPGIDNMVEILLVNVVKQCANTKKLTSQLANLVASTLLANVSYHLKLLHHVWNACQDKNVQPRSYAPGWIAVLLETHIDHKSYIERSEGVDLLVKCIKRGLADANPGVRENMRKTYWKFAAIWPDQANVLLEGLDANSRKLLDKANPDAAAQPKGGASTLRPPPLGRSATAPARPSIREAILAQKKSRGNLKSQMTSAEVASRAISPPPAGPTGLASAPVRRPNMKPRPATANDNQAVRSASPVPGRASPVPTNSTRNRSGTPPVPGSPPSVRVRGATPARAQSPLVTGPRKLTVLEQLNSPDWKVRVEGIVVVACILAKRSPPDYEGQKMPTLPPSDIFAPTLAKLFNDPQSEVVEHLVAPEVLAELAKVVPMEQIIPKVLLLSEGDDEQHAQPINASTMPALKQLMTDVEATDLLLKIIQSMKTSGVLTKKLVPGSFTPTQKRKITHGGLVWLNELAERCVSGMPNVFFSDRTSYKQIVNRFIQMMSTMKPPNTQMLATLLKNLQRLDEEAFNKTLSTYEPAIAKELRRSWGLNIEEDESIIVEERVADVEQVLGSVPEVGGAVSMSRPESVHVPPAPSPATPPPLSTGAEDGLKNLPALPVSPEAPNVLDPDVASRKIVRQDENPSIKVYQDPVVESNGAIATAIPLERSTLATNKEWQNYGKLNASATVSPKASGDSGRLLQSLIMKLQNRDMDTQAFRKLIGVARENPVREPLQEANRESVHDIWQGGSVFRELLVTLLEYLMAEDIEPSRATDLRVQGLLVLKQLLSKAAPYFDRHEAEILTTLISLRGKYPQHSQITTAIEEISEEYMMVADPKVGIAAILDLNLPAGNPTYRPATQSWSMSLQCLAALVGTSKPSALEPQYMRLGQLALKSLNDDDSEIRRSCVTMCIEMHSKLNDDERLFDEILKGMKSGHQNLLAYYFTRRQTERQ